MTLSLTKIKFKKVVLPEYDSAKAYDYIYDVDVACTSSVILTVTH